MNTLDRSITVISFTILTLVIGVGCNSFNEYLSMSDPNDLLSSEESSEESANEARLASARRSLQNGSWKLSTKHTDYYYWTGHLPVLNYDISTLGGAHYKLSVHHPYSTKRKNPNSRRKWKYTMRIMVDGKEIKSITTNRRYSTAEEAQEAAIQRYRGDNL